MIHLLSLLRWALWLRRGRTAPAAAPTPSGASESSTETTPAPQWQHAPTQPRDRAEMCGEPACDNPVGEHESGEWCSNKCYAAWITAKYKPASPNEDPFVAPDISPAPPAEPAWMAGWTGWERKKAEVLIEARKSPAAPYVPGAAAKAIAEAMADYEPPADQESAA